MKINIETIFKDSKNLCHTINDEEQNIPILLKLLLIIIVSGAIYGFTMGIYNSILQGLSSSFKVPLLFLLTLIICLPTLHFIGLFFGSKIKILQSLIILLHGISINSVLLAAFSPISIFFMLSKSNYKFIMIMHVIILGFCGLAGLKYIYSNFLYFKSELQKSGNEDNEKSKSNILLIFWIVLYMIVGTQMAYLMSPFVGSKEVFILFRGPESNFIIELFNIIFHNSPK